MVSSSGEGFAKELFIVSGLVGVQLIMSVYMVFLNRILGLGLNPLFLSISGSLATSLFLLPFAVVLERKKWPARLSPALMAKLGLIAFGGVTAFQALVLLGIKKTSPAIASAMPNLAPGFIFIIAACLRMERFEIRCKYTQAKIWGTLVCLGGAIAMSFLQSPPSSSPVLTSQGHPLEGTIYEDWIMGCFCLLAAVIVISSTTVMQAATMIEFPVPFSLCVVTSFIGSTLTALVQFITEGKLDVGSPVISVTSIIAIVLVGGAMTSVCVAFQTWCVNQKGPVLVSIFNPIQTICSAVLSGIILRQVLSLGSIAGMLLMFVGLYIVLWAKKKEGYNLLDTDDMEKPMLS